MTDILPLIDAVRCAGCGSTWTDADLARERAANPAILSCCPERKPLTIDEWRDEANRLAAEIVRLRTPPGEAELAELVDRLVHPFWEHGAGLDRPILARDENLETMRETADALLAQAALLGEARKLAQFLDWALTEGSWRGHDIDGSDALDTAEALGLIVSVPYDSEKHGENDCDADPGDAWSEFSPAVRALLTKLDAAT